MPKEQNDSLARLIFIEKCNEHYLSEREIKYKIPKGMNEQETLDLIKMLREKKSEPVYGLNTVRGKAFRYWQTNTIERILHEIDIKGHDSKWANVKAPISGELTKDALIYEALYSSMIEGARTTKKRAEEMVRHGISPQDRSERMTLNNYNALQYIREHVHEDISKKFVCELHKILVHDTLEPEDKNFVGIYRKDQRYVQDARNGEIVYTPPPPEKLDQLMESLYQWMNFEALDVVFLHPVVKASMIHFYTVYIHPFVDGNGRMSRALMYYYLLKKQYAFFQYVSISKLLAEKRSAYYKAIKNVEDAGDDLTYFIIFSVYMVRESIDAVETEWNKSDLFHSIIEEQPHLNDRQKKFIKSQLKNKDASITIKKYMKTHKVVYETARTDLMNLVEKGIASSSKHGKALVFRLKG
ncbi:MAG: Fic family protein [Deltaproteobacteria bacterium CG_4_10_14_0_2_um_filter_43_8]|nr:MAG: cell filamentation protein Fic [Deltaproteobacteria bacterium CG11_big_fil_rev_8_21_14_0_20_42_23]PJA19048.1 MAG: Fic family protein [Deltaproteobacteria bacterium CG_4_10_14_0_2_um_filter_43_8]PJC65184.1 MAG: Fic family protein [Deltaproteobacteria bacterium CG_4_9_14_0_2_um_filter_42_21]